MQLQWGPLFLDFRGNRHPVTWKRANLPMSHDSLERLFSWKWSYKSYLKQENSMTIWSFLIRWIHCPLVLRLRANLVTASTVVLLFKEVLFHSNHISIYVRLPSFRNFFEVIFTKIKYLKEVPFANRHY